MTVALKLLRASNTVFFFKFKKYLRKSLNNDLEINPSQIQLNLIEIQNDFMK